MSRLFYCPKCKKEEITKDIYKYDYTIPIMRDGYGRPIRCYKCECGNYIAGSIDITGLTDDKEAILYYKEVIKEYNEDGYYFKEELLQLAELYYENKKYHF